MTSFNTDLEQPSLNVIIDGTLGETQDINSTVDVPNPIEGEADVPKLFEDQTVNPEEQITVVTEDTAEEKENLNDTVTAELELAKVETAFEPVDIELAPVNPSTTVVEKQIRTKRRRKLVIDEVKEIDSASMKNQLSDTSNILGGLELAPPTIRLMQLKETSGVDKMFSLTSRPLHNKTLLKLYTRNMITKNLADITNTLVNKSLVKPAKEFHTQPSSPSPPTTNIAEINEQPENIEPFANETSIEVDMNADNMSKSGIVDNASIIENDLSKQNNITGLSQQLNNELDEFEQLAGPTSVFNNTNVDDMLVEMPVTSLGKIFQNNYTFIQTWLFIPYFAIATLYAYINRHQFIFFLI